MFSGTIELANFNTPSVGESLNYDMGHRKGIYNRLPLIRGFDG